jgi:hypothetical protein
LGGLQVLAFHTLELLVILHIGSIGQERRWELGHEKPPEYPVRRGILVLSVTYQEDTLSHPFTNTVKVFKLRVAAPVAPHLRILLANSRNPHSCVGDSHDKSKVLGCSEQFANRVV